MTTPAMGGGKAQGDDPPRWPSPNRRDTWQCQVFPKDGEQFVRVARANPHHNTVLIFEIDFVDPTPVPNKLCALVSGQTSPKQM